MAKNTNVYFTNGIRFKPTVFDDGDTTVAQEIFAPATEGSRVTGIVLVSTAAVEQVALLQINNGAGVIAKLGHIVIPAGAGTDGSVASVSGLNRGNLPWLQIDSDGNPFIDMNSGMKLELSMKTTLAAGKTIEVTVQGGDYTA